MLVCPLKSHPDWVYAVEKLGEDRTLYLYDLLGQEIPSKAEVDSVFIGEKTKQIYNKQDVIELLLSDQTDEVKETMRKELTNADKDEFNKMAEQAGFNSVGTHWVLQSVQKLSRKLAETKNEFVVRKNKQIESGFYKQRDGKLVPITDSFNPEVWWVENQEGLVKFEGGAERIETMFTEKVVRKKLHELIDKYGPEGYSFRMYPDYIPPVTTVRVTNPLPYNRKIWKIRVIKPLSGRQLGRVLTDEDTQLVINENEYNINSLFDSIDGKTNAEIIVTINELEISDEIKKLLTLFLSRLDSNANLKIVVSIAIAINTGAHYDPFTNTITIYRNSFTGSHATNEELAITLAHELLHSFTHSALVNNHTEDEKIFVNTINRLYRIAKLQTKYSTSDAYESPSEFLSYVLTEKKYADELKNMKLNVFSRFVNAIKKLLGIHDNVYDYVLAATIDFTTTRDTFNKKPTFSKKLPRELDDEVYLQKDNPSHKTIYEKLKDFANKFGIDRNTDEYVHIESGQKFMSNQDKMAQIKITNNFLSSEAADRAKQLLWRRRASYTGEVVRFGVSSDLNKVATKISEDSGLGYDPRIIERIVSILNGIRKEYPGATLLSNVVVANTDLLLADTVDLVIIDNTNKIHLVNFETRQFGFADWLKLTKFGGSKNLSDRQRAAYRLSLQKDYFEKMTGIKVDSLNVLMLHTPIQNNAIVNVSLDTIHSINGIDTVPYDESVYYIYRTTASELSTGKPLDIFADDKVSTEVYDNFAEQEKERLKTHFAAGKILNERERIVQESIDALIYKKQLLSRKSKGYERASMERKIEELLAEKDTEQALAKILEFAQRESKRIWLEYQRYQKEGKEVPLRILYGWRDSVSAFDAIMNEEAGLRSIILRETNFKGGPEYLKSLNETMSMISTIKGLYEVVGIDRLVDFLSPYYNGLYAEMRRKKQKEYRKLKFRGNIPDGMTEHEFVDKAINENGDNLEIQTKNLIRAELKKASRDIGVLTRWIDNLLDSSDPVTAAMVKAFAMADENSRIETLAKRDEMVLMLRRLEAWYKTHGMSPKSNEEFYNFMLERDSDGNLTGHILTESKSEMWNEYREHVAYATIEYTDPAQRRFAIKTWLDQNMPLQPSFKGAYWLFIEEQVKLGNISPEGFKVLEDQTFLQNKLTISQMMENNMLTEEEGDLISHWVSEHTWEHRIPISKWINPQWKKSGMDKISKDTVDVRGEFYNYILNLRRQADRYIPFTFRLDTRLPGIIKQNHERIKSGQSIAQITINTLKDDFTFRVDDTHRHEEVTDESGHSKYFLPVHFTGRITKEIKVKTPEGITETIKVFDPEEQSFDIAGMYYRYWSMANDYNHKSDILPQMELAKFMIDKRPATKRDMKGNIITRVSTTIGGRERKGSDAKISNTQLAQQVNDWFLSCVYGQYEQDAGKLGKMDVGKFVQALNKYTALNLLGVNFIAGTANVILGETLERVETIAREYVTPINSLKADKWYTSHLRGTLSDIGAISPKHISTKLYEWLGVVDNYGVADMDRKTKFGQLMHLDTLFFTSHVGEHLMQNRFALAMLDNIRAYDKNGKDIGSILDMVQTDSKGQITFKSEMDLEKSKWTDGTKGTRNYQLEFKMKTRGVLSRIHGEYSKLGRVAIERMAVGRMAYMFRKFVVPGFRRRWGREQYIERLGQYVEGNYITTGKFLGNVGGHIFGKIEEHSEYSFLQRLMSNLQSFKMSLMSEEWASLDDHERANIVRTISEVGFLVLAIIMANIAMNMRGESDDPDEERFWSFIAYQAFRLQNELLFFTPKLDSAMSILRSPAASISVIENIIKLSGQIFHPMAIYESGAWKGRPKIFKTLMNMTPVERQFYRLRDITDQVTFVQNAAFGGAGGSMGKPIQ